MHKGIDCFLRQSSLSQTDKYFSTHSQRMIEEFDLLSCASGDWKKRVMMGIVYHIRERGEGGRERWKGEEKKCVLECNA